MRTIYWAIFLWSLPALAYSSSASAFSEADDFWTTTQLQPGEYLLVEDVDGCREGTLRLLETESALTLMLGSRALAIENASGQEQTVERACETVESISYGDGRIENLVEETCRWPDRTDHTNYHTLVKSLPGGMTYRETVSREGETLRDVECLLMRVEEQPQLTTFETSREDMLAPQLESVLSASDQRELLSRLDRASKALFQQANQMSGGSTENQNATSMALELFGYGYAFESLANHLSLVNFPPTSQNCIDIREALLFSYQGDNDRSRQSIPLTLQPALEILGYVCSQ